MQHLLQCYTNNICRNRYNEHTHLCLDKLVFLLEKFQVCVDKIEVVLGRDIVAPTQLVFEVGTELSDRDVYHYHVCDNSFTETIWHQRILQRSPSSHTACGFTFIIGVFEFVIFCYQCQYHHFNICSLCC